MDLRKSLYGNIVLSGGSTLTKGFGNRLLHEVQRLAVKDMRIKILAPPERIYTTWTGGSILAGLSTFKKVSRSLSGRARRRLTRVADVGGEGRVAGEPRHYPYQIRLDAARWLCRADFPLRYSAAVVPPPQSRPKSCMTLV